jgi:hypothetical protein
MSILNRTNDGLVSVLIALCKALVAYGPLTDNDLVDLVAPATVGSKDMARKTLFRWKQLGAFLVDAKGRTTLVPSFRSVSEENIDLFREALLDLVLQPENNATVGGSRDDEPEASRASDLTRALCWVLAQDPYSFPATWDAVERLQNEQGIDPTLFINSTRWNGFEEWSVFLGFCASTRVSVNATKSLLLVKKLQFVEHHGVSGETIGDRSSITNERVILRNAGILPTLCGYLGDTVNGEQYSLRDLLYNLAYIHRAFSLSLPSCPELFIPIKCPLIVRSNKNNEAWFCAQLDGRYASAHVLNKLTGYERDESITDRYIIRKKRRFTWQPRDKGRIATFAEYHCKLRKDLQYIYSPQRLWYLKRKTPIAGMIARSPLVIAFAAMHKLSELARYSPDMLGRHFEGRYNWLLSEFISVAPNQFIDAISSEMTGYDFMPPGRIA